MTKFLGLDFSTQKLKAVLVDANLKLIHQSEVEYDVQIPEFRTQGGAIRCENGSVTTPVILWVKALDLILEQLQLEGVNFADVSAVSGAAQQHGSVYWKKGSREVLKNLDSAKYLHEQLQGCFSVLNSPIWMDSSTASHCRILEEAVGGPKRLADLTGSRAYERFTWSQIAKMAEMRPAAYSHCDRISLVSSFACSLFLGDYADIDYPDASGMNLMNIRTKEWDNECLQAFNKINVREKLGSPVPPGSRLGFISNYFVKRFGFSQQCAVVSFTGDNPCTCAGMRMSEKDIIVSLGTSDTVIVPLQEPRAFLNGHVMCSATNRDAFLGLLCFRNGSMTRERIKNHYANCSWVEFEELLHSSPPGNGGNFGLYFDNQEILPCLQPGDFRWNSEGQAVCRFPSRETEVRALIEGQFLTRRIYAEEMGLMNSHTGRIIATGGASQNKGVLQVLADVFNMPVCVQECHNAAALGAAYLSKMAVEPELNFEHLVKQLQDPLVLCKPNKDSVKIYGPMLTRCKMVLSQMLANTTK